MTKLTLSRTLRAAAVVLALGGTAFTAMPAQAQSPSVEFRFGGPGFGFSFDTDRRRGHHWGRHCISDPQVRRDLRRDGYRNIR